MNIALFKEALNLTNIKKSCFTNFITLKSQRTFVRMT